MTTELTDAQIDIAARQLADAAQARIVVEVLDAEPADIETGYRIQDAGHRLHGGEFIGWKVGCTSALAQKYLGVDSPVSGRYRTDQVLSAAAQIATSDFSTAAHLEVEVGFRLLADIDAPPAEAAQLADAVEAFAAIEVVAGRLAAFPLIPGPQLVADNVAGAAMVVGPTLDLDAAGIRGLDTAPVTLTIDDEEVASGRGEDALGHPLEVLSWLAGHAAQRGTPLRSGDLVITGTCTGLVPARPGAHHVGRVAGTEVIVGVS